MTRWKTTTTMPLVHALVIAAALSLPGTAAPRQIAQEPTPRATLVIIYASGLELAADAWSEYRQGQSWVVITHAVDGDAGIEAQRTEVQRFIRAAHAAAAPNSPERFSVLLLGDADPTPIAAPAAATAPGSASALARAMLIPTWTMPQTDPDMVDRNDAQIASDHPYQTLTDGEDTPAFPLGRIPARSNDDALAVLDKIRRYESQRITGPSSRRITYVAGEGHFGAMDGVLESLFKSMVDRMVPDEYDVSMTYAKATSIYCPPPSKLTDTVLERMSEGSVLFNYLGHGSPWGFDSLHWNKKRFQILRVRDVERMPKTAPDAQLPIAFMSCCSVGHFDLPQGQRCLSEELLFHSGGGPVAVIAGSRVTHPYANAILQKDITHGLLVDRTPTVGMLDLMAERSLLEIDESDKELDVLALPIALAGKWKSSLKDLRRQQVKLYNLLGDPAMRLHLPDSNAITMKLHANKVVGQVDDMKAGRVEVHLQTARTSCVKCPELSAVKNSDDPDLESKAAATYPQANNRELARLDGIVLDGQFEITLPPETLIIMSTSRDMLLRAVAQSSDASNADRVCLGSMRMSRAPIGVSVNPSQVNSPHGP